MFTGVVKLAQIDDYISPSQNCIQPKIMKASQQQTKATVTLNDCLACSGCITSAESVLIEQMSLQKFKSILQEEKQVYLIISPQSLVSLSLYFQLEANELFQKLSQFFMNNFPAIKNMFFEAEGIKICHELILGEFFQKYNKKQTLICSECPGWVCYAQKTLSHEITDLMSRVKSPQQIMGRLIKQKYGPNCKVISIMPCFDKKLQAIRFDFEQKVKQVDITLATNQIQSLLKQFPQNYLKNMIVSENTQKPMNSHILLSQNLSAELSFLSDQTSNGYIYFILKRMNAINIMQKTVKNNDYIEITAQVNGKEIKMAKCYGFRNIQKVVSLVKRKKCDYAYVEIMACPGGCYGGGGQIRYQDKKSKDLVEAYKLLEKPYLNDYSLKPMTQQQFQKLHLKDFQAHYKPIQKSFQSTVMNW